ncbi:hypothetical protein LZ554_008667 [Drepanopeziza brunnea f. sp. 'monogermtubi']|nr:hypothetical protein LZ554_008667 [Drepanopeziza brunnea f. sp. 'monogermtubi']
MARGAEATERVRVETATAVAASVTKNTTAELKTLESRTAKGVVPAANYNTENYLNKTKRGAEVEFNGFPNGDMVDTVKQHPEITAKKAPSVAVGAVPFVQPEITAGGVAILGKMAADSSKKTVTQITSDDAEKIFKANSKDWSNDAKAEVKNDKLQAAEKAKGYGTEPPKFDATIVPAVIKAAEPTKVEGEIKSGKILPMNVQAPVSRSGEGSKQIKSEEATPVSLKIPIGADGGIKAVSKSAYEPKAEEKPTVIPNNRTDAPVGPETKTDAPVVPETIAKEATTPGQLRKAFKVEEKKIPDSKIESPKASNTTETVIDSNRNSSPKPAPIMPAKNSDEHVTDHIVNELSQRPSVTPQPAIFEPETTQATSSASLASVINTDKTITKAETLEQPAISDMTTISRESLDHLHSKIDALQEAVQLITKTLTTNLPPPTGEATDPVSEQVQKTSASQDTEVLAVESAQAQPSTAADASSPEPAVPGAASTETPAASAKKPGHAKRKSVIVTIGSYLWPFGNAPPKGADAKASTAEGSPAGPSVESPKKDTTTSAPGAKDSAAPLSDIPTPHIGAA